MSTMVCEWQVRVRAPAGIEIHVFFNEEEVALFVDSLPSPAIRRNGEIVWSAIVTKVFRYEHKTAKSTRAKGHT